MKFLLLALLLPGIAFAQQPPKKCTPFYLRISRADRQHDALAKLDIDGKWWIESWTELEEASKVDVGDQFSCVVRELISKRKTLPTVSFPNLSCVNMKHMWTILDDDPVIRACQPIVKCELGDVCS